MTVRVNGKKVVAGFDVFATTGGMAKPVDLVYNGIQPEHGVIEIRLSGDAVRGQRCEAMIQALEVGPGDGGSGTAPKTRPRE
jgi:hypothetical protein